MTIAHLADIHLGHRQYGLKQREDDMANSFRATLSLILDEDPDAILLPGDLFDSRDLRPKILRDAEKALEMVPEDVPVLVTRGNHDENLTPRDVTWLNYLHQRDHIVLLEANLKVGPDAPVFEPHDAGTDAGHAGFYDLETGAGFVRIFGLQWRGARTDAALETVAAGIEETNEEHGDPDYTILLGHFGIEDIVPSLGGNVTHAELEDVRDVVDYLALGHIHKEYQSSEWIYNPGSLEAHSTQEARDDWDHGYYTIDLSATRIAGEEYEGPGDFSHRVTHHQSRRRPYFSPPAFDVTPYDSFGDLRNTFREHIDEYRSVLEAERRQEEFLKQGEPRQPMIDLRFEGTLQFDRGEFAVDELAEWTETAYEALYVQTNTSRVTSAAIEELLSELDDEEVFVDGRLRTEALEQQVFETIATESQFSEHAEDVASLLSDAHRMSKSGESPDDIRDVVTEERRTLFPEKTADVTIDISEDPFAEHEDDEAVADDMPAADGGEQR